MTIPDDYRPSFDALFGRTLTDEEFEMLVIALFDIVFHTPLDDLDRIRAKHGMDPVPV